MARTSRSIKFAAGTTVRLVVASWGIAHGTLGTSEGHFAGTDTRATWVRFPGQPRAILIASHTLRAVEVRQ